MPEFILPPVKVSFVATTTRPEEVKKEETQVKEEKKEELNPITINSK